MECIDPGHTYRLYVLDSTGSEKYLLRFVKRVGDKFPGNTTAYPGTTTQEVLRACIDRATYVQNQIPCWETKLSIYLLGLVIWLYEYRAAKRHGRSIPNFHDSTFGQLCPKCGHVGCSEDTDESDTEAGS